MSAPPSRREILDGIAAVAREHLGRSGALAAEAALVADLGLDSIELLTLAAEVENRFQVALDPADDAAIATIGDLADRIEAKLAASAASAASYLSGAAES